MKRVITLTLTLIVSASTTVFASSINERQQHQRARIADGIQSGEITRQEGKRLAKQQRQIAIKEKRFRADGSLSRKERVKLQRSLSKSSASIYRSKHNKADRH